MATKSKGCLIGLVVIGAIAVIAIIGIGYFFKQAKDVVQDMATGVGVSPEVVQKVQTLNEKYEFEPPADNRLEEEQVARYIAIKEEFAGRVQSYKKKFEELDQRMKEGGGLQEVREGYKALANIRRDFLESLERHDMSPEEYAFLTKQIYETYFTASARTSMQQMQSSMAAAEESQKEQLRQLEQQLENEQLSPEVRESIKASMKTLEQAMHQAEISSAQVEQRYDALPKQNIEILNKYRDKLESLDTGGWEYWGLGMSGVGGY